MAEKCEALRITAADNRVVVVRLVSNGSNILETAAKRLCLHFWQWLYLQQKNENMMDKHEYRTTRN